MKEKNKREDVKEGEYLLEIGVMENSSKLPIREWVQQEIIDRTEMLGGKKYKVYRDIGPIEEIILDKTNGVRTDLHFEYR